MSLIVKNYVFPFIWSYLKVWPFSFVSFITNAEWAKGWILDEILILCFSCWFDSVDRWLVEFDFIEYDSVIEWGLNEEVARYIAYLTCLRLRHSCCWMCLWILSFPLFDHVQNFKIHARVSSKQLLSELKVETWMNFGFCASLWAWFLSIGWFLEFDDQHLCLCGFWCFCGHFRFCLFEERWE